MPRVQSIVMEAVLDGEHVLLTISRDGRIVFDRPPGRLPHSAPVPETFLRAITAAARRMFGPDWGQPTPAILWEA